MKTQLYLMRLIVFIYIFMAFFLLSKEFYPEDPGLKQTFLLILKALTLPLIHIIDGLIK